MKPCHFLCLSLVLSALISCATTSARHPEFTSKNVFDLRTGMTQKEIEDKFGSPDRTSIMTMGTNTPNPWQSLVYYYDMRKNGKGEYRHLVYTNAFYFVMDIQPPLLRSWELELIYLEKH